jgi:hypothetical protein
MHLQSFYVLSTFFYAMPTFFYLMPMLLYIWLLYAHLWPYFLHLQLPNTSLNGGNVCLATLHSSDRDLQPFYYVYMNTHVRLSLLPSSTSTYFANIFIAVNEHPCLPSSNKHFLRTALFHLSTTYTSHFRTFCEHFRDYSNATVFVVNIHVNSAHLANIIFLYFTWTYVVELAFEKISVHINILFY